MLTYPERELAIRALALKIRDSAVPRAAVVAMVAEPEFGLSLSSVEQNPLDLAKAAVDLCISAAWVHAPPWLCQVLEKVTQTPDVAELRVKISNPPPDWKPPLPHDPFAALWLRESGLPFLNRLKFREYLRRLYAPEGASVLLVNGLSKYGKSYSVELLYHAIREHRPPDRRAQRLPIGVIPLQRGMGASLSPETLARMIASRIQPGAVLPENLDTVTPDRVNERLCDWLTKLADDSGEEWWVVIDGLEDPDLTPLTRQFISKLVELLSIGKYRKCLRLLLVDYPPDQIAGVPSSQMECEELSRIGEVDLEPFFNEVLREPGGAPPSRLAVQMAVRLALAGLPENDSRLKSLNAKLREVVADV